MLKRKHIVALLFLVLSFGTSYSQLYPVQVTPQLIPPYSLQVSEYYSPTSLTSAKLNLLLLLRDVTKPQMRVRLRMTIESQGVSIKTREDVAYTPITIYSGEPKYVQPAELAEYFAPNNIEISGLSPQDYQTTGRLPEGYYTFCFQLVDIASGQTVSNKGCAYAWMAASEPPFLVLPNKGEAITPVNPQNLFFQWTPRQGANPNAYQNVEYVFTLKEITDSTVSPEAAFFTSPILFADTVTNTNQAYTPSYPQLVPGRNYAWQVQVRTQVGRDPVQFKNNGYSEISWFQYKNDCPQLTGITATVRGQQTIIQWQPNARHLEYQLNYREANNADAEWFSVTNTKPSVTIRDLKVGKTYEYKVGSACETSLISFNPPGNFTTSADSTISTITQCGIVPPINDTASNNLLATLLPDQTIKAGDYNVKVVTVTSGSNGVFSGTGYTPISWLGDMNIAVKFDNVTINAAHQLVRGKIQTTYDPTEGGIASVNELIDVFTAGYGVGSVVSGLPTVDTTVSYIIEAPANIAFAPGTGYDQNTGIGPVTLTITNASGQTVGTITTNKLPITIQDQLGNIYQVAKDGAVTKIGSAGGSVLLKTLNAKQLDADKAVVKFVHHPSEVYAFDEFNEVYKKSGTFLKEYERLGTDYYVSAKAIAPGKTDVLRAQITITDNTIIADSIKFISGKGVLYDSKKIAEGVYDINIIGGPEKDAQEIYAVYKPSASKTLNLGKVLVASYPRREYNIKLVPVDNATINEQLLKDSLNRIYGTINVGFNVQTLESFNNQASWDEGDAGLNVKGSSAFSNLTSDMKNLIREYTNAYGVDNSSIYLFILNQAADSLVKGDMPRGQRFGFVFTNNNNSKELTVAHEIAHGIFKLKHVFDGYGFDNSQMQENLMQYPVGNFLTKYQWDLINDPALVIGFFDSDESSQLAQVNAKQIPSSFKNPSGSNTFSFYDPWGRIVTLPSTIKSVTFSTGDIYTRTGTNFIADINQVAMVGSLIGFIDQNDSTWSTNYRYNQSGTIQILGFQNEKSGTYFKQNTSYTNIPKTPIIGRPICEGQKVRFQIVTVIDTTVIPVTNRQTFESVDFFSNYFVSNVNRSAVIDAFLDRFSDEATRYVLRNTAHAGKSEPYATYIFGLADFINHYPLVQNLCNTATDEGFEQQKAYYDSTISNTTERKEKLIDYYKQYFDLYVKYQSEGVPSAISFIASGCQGNSNSVWSYQTVSSLCVSSKIAWLKQLKCMLYTLTWSDRKQLLDMLTDYLSLPTTSWPLNFLDDAKGASEAVSTLCDKVPQEQRSNLLNYFSANNYKKLFTTYDNLSTGNSKETFANAIVTYLMEQYSQSRQTAVSALINNPTELTDEQRLNTIHVPIWNTTQLSDCGALLNPGIVCSSLLASFSEVTGNVDFSFAHTALGFSYKSWKATGNPYTTWVNIYPQEDFNYANIKAGSKLTVPLFYAYHLAKRHREKIDDQSLRIAANTLAIVGAAFTGGTSLSALAIIDVAASSADIVITINEDKLVNTQFYSVWNTKIMPLITLVQLGVPVAQSIRNTFEFKIPQGFKPSQIRTLETAVAELIAKGKQTASATLDFSKLALLKAELEVQILKYKIGATWKKTVAGSELSNSFNDLYIAPARFNGKVKIAEYRVLDNKAYYLFNKGNAKWIDDADLLASNVASNKIRKIGELDNTTTYYLSDAKNGEGAVEIYQDVNKPDNIFLARKLEQEVEFVAGIGEISQNLTGPLKSTYDDIIKFGGNAVEDNGVLKLLNKNGDEVAQISNGKILPTKYFDDVTDIGATAIGQPANGYQIFKNGDRFVVKRMPDKSAYSSIELVELTQHPNAHVLERHGHDVIDEALIKRANNGIAPDGSTIASGNPPPYSSKFESPQKVVEALNNTKPGTTAFNNGIQQGNRKIVTYTTSSGNFGKGVPRNGSTFQTTNKVLAVYQDVGSGNYQLLTMYPDF